ncbi:MAG: hypothetical protein LUH10_15695 [Tannerellaceae bacterium]|nr:hypothetical protein [Tannerellaceae bacterium]
MTPDKLNTALIDAIKEKIPEGANLANLLMDILSIGKEAIYRRFRGEVPFTLAEAVIISNKLGISLDRLSGVSGEQDGILDLNLYQLENPENIYYATVEHYFSLLKSMNPSDAEMWDTSNRIPYVFCLNFDSLSRFHLFKWLYQLGNPSGRYYAKRFEEVVIPAKLRTKEQDFLNTVKSFGENNYIWDEMIFKSFINDILYFKEIHMISGESIQQIKTDLLELINDMEKLASRGHFRNGNDVRIFLSHINFETSYSYIESQSQKMSFIKIYDLNIISSQNETVFESLKNWVQSLRKFSTIISQSAELERYKFFQLQREYVDQL